MKKLTNSDEDLCSYTGLFGILLALTCLIQHIIISRAHAATLILAAIFLFVIFAFTMLAVKNRVSPILLIVAVALALTAELIHILSGLFSVVVILLFIYCVTITIVIYMADMPAKFMQISLAKKAEEEEWKDKL